MWMMFVACQSPGPGSPVDLSAPLGPGEARAAVVTDPSVLFAGISAEGQVGDLMLINDRVRFVVQGARLGSGYLPRGGTVIDADIVRPDGHLGRDMVEEWSPILGFGRVVDPTVVHVVADGRGGGPAIVRVVGPEGALGLVEGAIELPGFVADLGMSLVTDYILHPDSWLLEVHTTVTGAPLAIPLTSGDTLMPAPEVSDTFAPGAGLGGTITPLVWTGLIGDRNDVAMVLAAAPGQTLTTSGGELLAELADMVTAYSPDAFDLANGSHTHTRLYGVGPDLATLSGAVSALHGEATRSVDATVTAPDGPVAGARVHILVDGAPYTVAISDADGAVQADVPEVGTVTFFAEARGTGQFMDRPGGAVSIAPDASEPVLERALAALADGAPAAPEAVGRGVGGADPLVLGVPAELTVRVDDDLPFAVRLAFVDPDPVVDSALVPDRPDGLAAAGWSRDGELVLAVEAGTYDLVVHRGARFEIFTTRLTLEAGAASVAEATLPAAFAHPGWLYVDPHTHASPSPDGQLSMEDRLVVAAAVGVQVHFGTDHDFMADYRPLLAPLGLTDVLASVVADEVSPPLRGHFNIYPVSPTEEPNGGAWSWWREIPDDTEDMVDRLRERHGDEFVLQSNHPTDAGIADASGWSVGEVSKGGYWTDRLETVEVLNASEHDEFFTFWMDLVLRGGGQTPVGVSDSHSHFGGNPGLSAMYLGVGIDDPSVLTETALVDAMRAGRTIPSLGVFLDVDVDPGATVAPGTAIAVAAQSASWVQVDRLLLLEDGVEVDRIEGTSGTFVVNPDADALFVVVAEGDQAMLPLSSRAPWAMAGPYRVDVGGDGWTPPLPPLAVDP